METLTPVVARRRLGALLKDLRTQADLKIDDAARALECSTSKISRLENGKGLPRQRDVRDLVRLYGTPASDREDELAALVTQGLSGGQGLVTSFRDVFDGDMVNVDAAKFIELEAGASSIACYSTDLVPGLLQTPQYAWAVARLFFPGHAEDELRRFVDLRMRRKEVLTRAVAPLRFAVVLDEGALHREIGGPEVMLGQIQALAELFEGELADVSFHLAPLGLATVEVLGGGFTVVRFADERDQDVVYLEGRSGATYLEKPEDVTEYAKAFEHLVAQCPSREESIKILQMLVGEVDRAST